MQKIVFGIALVLMFFVQLFIHKKLKKQKNDEDMKNLHRQISSQRATYFKKISQIKKDSQPKEAAKQLDGEKFVLKMMKKHKKQIYKTIIKNIQHARKIKKVEALPYEERNQIIKQTIDQIKRLFIDMFLGKRGDSMDDLHKINLVKQEEGYYANREKEKTFSKLEYYKMLSQATTREQNKERNHYVRELMENRRLKAMRLDGHNVREFFC